VLIFIWVVLLLAGVVLIGLVLMQHGKGADMGAAFGTGSAGSLFGSAGSANFLSRSTAVAAFIFFSACLGLTYMYNHQAPSLGVIDKADLTKSAQPAAAPAPSQSSVIPK